jgi:hypothetical protein
MATSIVFSNMPKIFKLTKLITKDRIEKTRIIFSIRITHFIFLESNKYANIENCMRISIHSRELLCPLPDRLKIEINVNNALNTITTKRYGC